MKFFLYSFQFQLSKISFLLFRDDAIFLSQESPIPITKICFVFSTKTRFVENHMFQVKKHSSWKPTKWKQGVGCCFSNENMRAWWMHQALKINWISITNDPWFYETTYERVSSPPYALLKIQILIHSCILDVSISNSRIYHTMFKIPWASSSITKVVSALGRSQQHASTGSVWPSLFLSHCLRLQCPENNKCHWGDQIQIKTKKDKAKKHHKRDEQGNKTANNLERAIENGSVWDILGRIQGTWVSKFSAENTIWTS